MPALSDGGYAAAESDADVAPAATSIKIGSLFCFIPFIVISFCFCRHAVRNEFGLSIFVSSAPLIRLTNMPHRVDVRICFATKSAVFVLL